MHSQKQICLVRESCLPKLYQIVDPIEQTAYQKDFRSKMNNLWAVQFEIISMNYTVSREELHWARWCQTLLSVASPDQIQATDLLPLYKMSSYLSCPWGLLS